MTEGIDKKRQTREGIYERREQMKEGIDKKIDEKSGDDRIS